MLFLALCVTWVSAQQALGPGAGRPIKTLLVPDVALPAPESLLAADLSSSELLQLDTNIQYRAIASWQAGDQLGVVLEGSSLQYPLSVQSVVVRIVTLPGFLSEVDLRVNIYAMEGTVPGALLGSSAIETISPPQSNSPQWVTLDLATPVELATPQPFLVAVEYLSGTSGQTPPVLHDISNDVPQNLCYYYEAGVWAEHYARVWQRSDGSTLDAGEVGYPMIRAIVETSGGPSDTTVTMAEADSYLSSLWPEGSTVNGESMIFWVGRSVQAGDTRGMIRFPNPESPFPGSTPIAAKLRLYQSNAITLAVPLEITTYRMTDNWDELVTGWVTHAQSYAEPYGSDTVPIKDLSSVRREHLLEFDVSNLVIGWLQGLYENHGIMLMASPEGVTDSLKEIRSHDYISVPDQHPRLLVEWVLPDATPMGTPPATLTPTPTSTTRATPTATASVTATPTETSTPQPTATATATITPGGPTLTPTEAGSGGLYLPLVIRLF